MRALLALAVLVTLLGPLVPVEATFGDNGLTTFTGRAREPNTLVFGNDMVTEQATQATLNFAKDVLKGTWKPVRNDPPSEKREVELDCLNSVAPAPLNWKMWCPGTDAKVVGWLDKSGAAHRQITLRPQAGMTSTMYQWFITTTVLGLMPPIVEFQGNHYHYYHLWHPLDHVESTWSLAPKVPILQKGMPVYVLIHERYRNPANFTHDRHYETNGWFYVEDAFTNLMKNRYVITMPYWGIPTWTMILEFNDTPEGLVVDVEVIAGVPHKGYDERAPTDGYKMAAGMNELFTAPLLARQKGSYDWEESINAITRHVIEEFSNLQHFVPYLYAKSTLLGKAGLNWVPTLGTWLQQNNASVADSTSISFYHTLEKLAAMQVPKNGTLQGKLIDAQFDVINKTLLAGQKLLTKANEGLSRKTFVPLSNTLTALSHNRAQANGPHPEADAPPKGGIKGFWDKLLNASEVTTTTETLVVDHGMLHTILAGAHAAPAAGANSSAPGNASTVQQQPQQEDEEDEEDDSKDDSNAAWKLRLDLKKAAEEPASDTDDDDSADADADDNGSAIRSAQLAAAYMDAGPHTLSAATLGAAAAAASSNGTATTAVSAPAADATAAAIEVPGLSLADTHATIRALDNKNVSGMLAGIKQDILAGLENHTISFHGSNNTLRLPESVLTAMAAKHALHKGVLSALLNKADLGLGSNISVWTTPDAAYYPSADSPAAADGGQGPSLNDKVLTDLALKTVLSKGGALAALLSNASPGANVTFLPVPHAVFTAIQSQVANSTTAQAGTGSMVPAPMPAVNATKPGLKGSLQRLGHSVQRAKRLAQSFKPALSLNMPLFGGNSSQSASGGSGRGDSDKSLQVKLKFWGDQGRV